MSAGTNIFSAQAGKVVAIDGSAVPVVFTVDGDKDTIHDLHAIVTSVGIQGQGGYQFKNALREFIYVYVFTERVGEIIINGLAFPATCNFGPQGPQGPQDTVCRPYGKTGLERVLTWYECNRITNRASPVEIMFGPELVYDAFLVAVKADIVDASTGIAQFTFQFNFIPNITDKDDFCFPLDTDCLDEPCDQGAVTVVDDLGSDDGEPL